MNAAVSNDTLPAVTEWRRYSQNGEDGVLAHLFEIVGATDRLYVEIGCGDGSECNTRNLRESGWRGWMFDAAYERPDIGLVKAWITRENVADLLRQHGVPRAFDLLSLGIDFNDFHVLDRILAEHAPRVIVVEYNAALGPDADAVVPYLPGARWDGSRWFGASLTALCRLAAAHGYVPVYCESAGVNVFMVRADVWGERPRPAAADLYRPPAYGPNGQGHPPDPQARPFLSSAHYLVPGAARAFTRYGAVSYLANDEYIGRVFAAGGYWEETEVRAVAALLGEASGYALDVGAHVGSHSLALARLCPRLSFICFEPQAALRLLLERNIAENGLADRFVVSPKAVAHTEMTVALSARFSDGSAAGQAVRYDGTTRANYGGVQLGTDGERIETIQLDSLASLPIAYIKLDVEGAERLALGGARQLLGAQRPLLLFEHRDDRQLPPQVIDRLQVPAELRTLDVRALLASLGYRLAPLGQDILALPPAATSHTVRDAGAARSTDGVASVSTAADPDLLPSAPLAATADCPATIPPILFQTWKTRDDLPAPFAVCRQSFLDACPHFATPLWDDRDNRDFVAQHFPWFLPVFDAYPKEIYRADAVRYFFLYAYGGIYADLDVYCLKPLDGLLAQSSVVLGRMGADPDFVHSIPNAVMASSPRHPFWLLVIAHLIEAQRVDPAGRPEWLTGPVLLKTALDCYAQQPAQASEAIAAVARRLAPALQPAANDSVAVLCANDWFPFNWADPIHQMYRQALRAQGVVPDVTLCRSLFPNATLTTFWSHSWEPEPAPQRAATAAAK